MLLKRTTRICIFHVQLFQQIEINSPVNTRSILFLCNAPDESEDFRASLQLSKPSQTSHVGVFSQDMGRAKYLVLVRG